MISKNKIRSLRQICLVIIILWLLPVAAFSANIRLSGRVTDEKGEIMIGVNIKEKGTNNNTVTSVDGTYNIVLESDRPVLVVTYLGYKTQEIQVGPKQQILDIVLEENISELNEVVVVGYGEQRKIAAVGAQSQLKVKDLKTPAGNLASSLAGRLSGVVVIQKSGEPGHDDSDIWIRGISTFTNQNQSPLILVDGVERSFSNIDPEDIESFTVLKDASATAVYGVRGANGVIIIKTKPGKPGKPSFSIDYYEGFTRFFKTVSLANGIDYMEAANEAYANSSPGGDAVKYTPEFITATKKANGFIPNDDPSRYNSYLYPSVDWMKEVFNDWGHNRRANINVRGGVPNASYYASLSYYNETGLTKTDALANYNADMSFTRYNYTTNINLKATDKTAVDIGVYGYFSEGNYPYVGTTEAFVQAMDVTPVDFPVLYPDGSVPGISTNYGMRNPYGEITQRGYKNEYRNQVNSNLRVTQDFDYWKWSKGLKAYAMIAFDVNNNQNIYNQKEANTYYLSSDVGRDPATGLWLNPYDESGNLKLVRTWEANPPTLSYSRALFGNRSFYFETALNYDRVFAKNHRVGALFLFNLKTYRDANAGDFIAAIPYKNRGISGRVTYAFLDRYFLEFNAGYNASENFSPKNRYGFFPAFGAGWAVSEEPFWKVIKPYVSFLKVRYTNGLVGSDVAGNRRFGYLTIVKSGQTGYAFGNEKKVMEGIAITDYGTDIRWSVSRKQDLGIDLKFLNDQLSFIFDFYKEHRTGIFLERAAVPGFVGLSSMPWANLGVVDNKGVEISMDYTQRLAKNVAITARANLSLNEDKIIEDDQPTQPYPWMEKRGRNVLARYGYVAEGLFTSEEEIKQHARQFGESEPGETSRIGDIKYADLNNDGAIDQNDVTKIGRGRVPNLVYGFGVDIQIGNFAIGALFQGTHGADVLLSGKSIQPFIGDGGIGNLYSNITDRWSADDPTNQNVFYPRLAWGGGDAHNVNNFKPSTWWVKDISYLRFKQLSISYNLPRKWMEKIMIKNARIYVMGSNLFTFSPFKLWDPELNTSNGGAYPNISSYSIGLNFNF
ncbi:SusC/RagA family TonB-linked outer membrane protein [Coprobacter tertius]|uniref:TonB-dependent receptor n=1 Tax=Coprobacter tertius TaxID=2944915 RepID=A0ABT1MFS3_9BACT|nr:TonB-dependent receptor [Coprobacter tertius]MCP9611492.1 TonB-dependent receptor [Coprobacter tertius]